MNIAYIQTKEDRNGKKLNYTYNSSNQLIKMATDLGNSLSKTVDIQYNSKGQMPKTSYDGKEFSYRYNAAGYLEYVDQLRYVTGEKTTTQFIYKNNRIATIIDPNGRKTDYTDENENLVKVQEPQEVNGVEGPADRPGTSYTLDQASKIATVTDAEDNTTVYHVNDNYVVTKVTDPSGKVTEYKLDQLTKETLPDGTQMDYGYDTVGNRVSKKITKDGVTKEVSSQYNEANQLVQVGDKKYVYDANGNLQSDGNRTYEARGRFLCFFYMLVKIKDSTGKVLAEYSYDEEGRRISSNDSHGKTFYTYNGNQVLYEEDENKNVIKGYTYDDDGHPLTMFYKGNTYYYLTNYRGDVLAMTDESGKVVASYTYDAWGNILSQSGELAEINPYRYAGYRYDDDTKLYYLMARYYNPENGVFLSLDPVRGDLMEPQTLNGYNYANNNPIMNIDPDGNYWKNTFWNSKYFLSRAFNWAIFTALATIGGYTTVFLKQLAKKQLSKAKGQLFNKQLKKQLTRRGISNKIASKVVAIVSVALSFYSYFADPGSAVFIYLDSRDKKPNNGYLNNLW
ncbi:MAG TPA: hypothetical protein DG757_11355 [Bacillus sp. (in: Bacteria)]|nr:hypothetical protein [Bacillus sp. (in: firmicutes)]